MLSDVILIAQSRYFLHQHAPGYETAHIALMPAVGDLNKLAAGLVRRDGLLLTCSCSGALGREAFVDLVVGAARQAGRPCILTAGHR